MLRRAWERRGLMVIALAGATAFAASARAEEGATGKDAKVEAPSGEAREEADRVFLGGDQPGSLAKPIVLQDEAQVARVCADLEGARRASREADAYQAPKKKELRERQRLALRNVYRVTVLPGGFQAGTYRAEPGVLPLKVDRGMVALDGALTLQVMKKKGAELELSPEAAKSLVHAIEDKKVGLTITFRPDQEDAASFSPCFSPAKSGSYVLRVDPIDYELVDLASKKRIAAATTPERKALERFVDPGAAELTTAVQIEGGLDPEALTRALDARKSELSTCLQPVLTSKGGTGVLGYGANVLPSGALEDVRLEVDALEAPDASACVAKVIGGLSVGKGARASRAHLTIGVERVPPGAKDAEVVGNAVN